MPYGSHSLPPTDLRDIVGAALDIPVLATLEGRDAVLALLRPELTASVPRLPTARMDTISIVVSCARYGGLVDLVEAIRCFDRGSIAMTHLDAIVARATQPQPRLNRD